VTTTEKRISTNPSHPLEILAFSRMPPGHARQAVEERTQMFDMWKKVSPQERRSAFFARRRLCRERSTN